MVSTLVDFKEGNDNDVEELCRFYTKRDFGSTGKKSYAITVGLSDL